MSLYSPELTLKPQKYVIALYSRPSECGIVDLREQLDPVAVPARRCVVVAHSPTPSMVRIAARVNGEG